MLVSAVALWEVVLALHILSVVVAFGATFAYPVIFAVAAKEPRSLPTVYRMTHAISQRVITPGLLAVVVFGIYLASKLHMWSHFFVQWGLAVAIVIGAVEGAFLGPREKRLIAVAEADIAAAGADGRASVDTPSQSRYSAPSTVSTVSSSGQRATRAATPAATTAVSAT